MSELFLDLETIPSQRLDAMTFALEATKPPGTLKKPESIRAWWDTEGQDAIHENWLRQALDPAIGEISCVGFATEDGTPRAVVRERDEEEGPFLRRAWRAIMDELHMDPHWHEARRPFVVGHNVAFDLRFMHLRAWANRLRLPAWFPKPDARAGRDYGCTMTTAAGFGGRLSLDALCRALGVQSPKTACDGRQAVELWLQGRMAELAAYCAADVAATRECWHIMTGCGLEGIE